MISPRTAQAATVALLLADAPLVALVGAEIRESEWQGTAFTYPAVRVDLLDLTPEGNGSCAEAWSAVTGRIRVFSNQASSGQCLDLLAAVQRAVQRKHLIGVGYTSLEMKIASVIMPYQEENIWRGEVAFFSTIIPT
jgi:hypothetical protein